MDDRLRRSFLASIVSGLASTRSETGRQTDRKSAAGRYRMDVKL